MTRDRAAAITEGLGSRRFGRRVSVHVQVGSTNDEAVDLAAQGAPEGTTVLAAEQTGGRGRRRRAWHSPAGGLWMSVVLRPAFPVDRWPLIGFAAAVGAAQAIERIAGVRVEVKWPNDLMIGERKLGGILVEAREKAVIVGIGINANIARDTFPPDIARTATSLLAELAHPMDLDGLARAVLEQFERVYDLLSENPEEVLAGWRERDLTRGRQVKLSGAIELEGVAEDVDHTGALLVRTSAGVRRIMAGEVSIRTVSSPHR